MEMELETEKKMVDEMKSKTPIENLEVQCRMEMENK